MRTTFLRPALRPTLAVTAFAATVLAANLATTRYGLLPVGFGLTATAGTYLAGASFVARDTVQDVGGRRLVALALAVGACLSWALSAPAIATASVTALLLSEVADLAIYTPLRARGYIRAAVASNLAGSVVDSVVFLTVAGFPLTTTALAGQVVGKTWITLAVVALVLAVRATRAARTTAAAPVAVDAA
jgi:uncharacterized PurR-regulated membrane protein YhhQ (DUF165 family)